MCLKPRSPLNGKSWINRGTMAAHSPLHCLWSLKCCLEWDCCLENHVYRFAMNGTITIKRFSLYSLPFSSTLLWDEWDLYGRRLEWVEPRTNLPSHSLTKLLQSAVTILKITWHFIMTHQATIASVIEVRISTDLSGADTSNYPYDPWSCDEILAR